MWLWGLVACGGGHAVIYRPAEDGALVDADGGLLSRGRVESEEIVGPHVTGGVLRLVATRKKDPPSAWTAETLEPEIAEISSSLATDDGIELELRFLRQGTTDLFLFDGSGTVIDVQRLQVRDPVGLELLSWDDVVAGGAAALSQPLHLVPDTRASVLVSWVDRAGEALVGGGLVQIDTSQTIPGVEIDHRFDGQADRLDLQVAETASSGRFSVEISAPTQSLSHAIEIHDRDEVDRVELVQRSYDENLGEGMVLAEVYAGEHRVSGAPVLFSSPDHEAQAGTVVRWREREGELTALNACFDAVCDTLQIPGRIVEISDAWSEPSPCGCQSSQSGGTLFPRALLLLALLRRRATAA